MVSLLGNSQFLYHPNSLHVQSSHFLSGHVLYLEKPSFVGIVYPERELLFVHVEIDYWKATKPEPVSLDTLALLLVNVVVVSMQLLGAASVCISVDLAASKQAFSD